MTSGGGWCRLATRRPGCPPALLLSGPAGGVRAGAALAAACGYPDAVTFDMGGTSTDVCLVRGGVPEPAPGREVGGFPVRLPALDIHTIGAGGGSIARLDPGGALVVGPESAGADPGPACYGQGGTAPTVTDADLVLGRIPVRRRLPRAREARHRGGGAGHRSAPWDRTAAGGSRRPGLRGRERRRCRDGAGGAGRHRGARCRSVAEWRWSPSAVPGPCTPARWPMRSACRP